MIVNGKRELAYTVKVDDILPIEGYDRVETACIGGWRCIVQKGDFKPGDIGVYFEVDSKLPVKEPFLFMAKRKFRVKTIKMCKTISQGLLMPISAFTDVEIPYGEGVPLTDKLGITYYVQEDNERKSAPDPELKYKRMARAYPKVFSNPVIRAMMKYKLGKKILYTIFGNNEKFSKKFPTQFPYIKVTDEERIENIPWMLNSVDAWVETSKIDGTSTTFILERKAGLFGVQKYEYYVCSRNVRQLDEDQKCYHDKNVYWEMSNKYRIREVLQKLLELHPDWDYVCIQGETAGPGVQGNPHQLKELQFFGFNFIDSNNGRWDSREAAAMISPYGIQWVPITNFYYHLPHDMETFKAHADGPCDIPGGSGLREGFVYRKVFDPDVSFKNVSNKYLLKEKD